MSDEHKAVFLSYASQDADAAKRICDALRQSGVEVWFDVEGGLEHGDEWDAKIRRQIKECVLFIPLVSANTQARHEGYFRLEWDMAAERARGIASGVAFILPVVIDDTREPDALVPDRFRAVQWTRLPGGVVPPDVQARFLKLWSHRTGTLKHEASQASAAPDHATVPRSPRRRVAVAAWGGAILAVAAGAFFLFRPTTAKDPERPVPAATPPPESLTEARKLAQRARAVFDATTVVRQDMELAEQLVQKAEALDPTDAYVWAVAAQVDAGFVLFAYDGSDTRVGQALAKAERAFKMAPELFEARLAKAFVLTYSPAQGSPPSSEASRLVEGLLKEQPANRRVLLIQGMIMQVEGRWDEAARVYRMAQDRWAEGWALLYAGRLDESEALAEGGFKTGQAADDRVAGAGDVRQALMLLLSLNLRAREDLEATQKVMDRMPPDELREDETACYAADLYLMLRQPEKVLEIMRALPRDWLVPRDGEGPYKADYSALAHQMANHPEAAAIEWRAALKLVEERLAARPNAPGLVLWKARLLARLGERAEAERMLQLYEQMQGRTRGTVTFDDIDIYLVLGRREEVLAALPKMIAHPFFAFWFHAYLRFDPTYDPLRGDPRFEKLLRETMPKSAKPFDDQRPAAAISVIDQKSVAVLAFANLSDDKGNEYFSDGISEELLTVLQKIPGLRVAARMSAFSFKGMNATAQEIGEKLGVATLVEGSVRKSGNSVRISARLSRAATGEQLWSESYTRDLQDVFAVQSELAQTIVEQLRGQLGDGGAAAEVKAAVRGGTTSPEAHQQYLQGRYQLNRFSMESFEKALVHFERATAIDPNFALAWAALSRTRVMQTGLAGNLTRPQFEAALNEARRAANRALELEPDLPDTLNARFEIQFFDFDWKGGAKTMSRALALAPSDPVQLNAASRVAAVFRDHERAVEVARQAVVVDPVNPEVRTNLAAFLLQVRRPLEARAEYLRVAELNPATPWAFAGVGVTYLLEGKYVEAMAASERESADWARYLVSAIGLWGLHRTAEADAALDEMIKVSADTGAYQIAEVFSFRGDKDQAFAWLDRARRQQDGGLSYYTNDPFLDNLRSDPRWAAFQRSMGWADDQLK